MVQRVFFEVGLSEKVMKMDFEHTEDPDTLDQMNKAKEGISWYSGGVVGILNGFFNIVSNGVNGTRRYSDNRSYLSASSADTDYIACSYHDIHK